jgi:trk system potassium uptake protein TrkA
MYVIIIGCGSLGRTLVEHLTGEDHEVVIIEKEEEKAKKFAEEVDALVINGDGSDAHILKDAGIDHANAIAVLTEEDNTNLTICQMVKKFENVKRIVARVNDPTKQDLYLSLNITAAISPMEVIVSYFKNAITQTGKSIVSIAKGKAEILELNANERLENKKIRDIELPPGAMIGLICRSGEVIIAHPEELIKKHDLLVIITKTDVSKDVLTMLK